MSQIKKKPKVIQTKYNDNVYIDKGWKIRQ